jgi:hypothetical protein
MDHIVSCVQIGMVRSALLIVMALSTTCDAGAPKPKPEVVTPTPPATPTAPPAAKFTHPHAVARKALITPHTDQASIPKHGIVVHSWGLGGDSMVVIDQDASTMRVVENIMGKDPSDKTRKLDRKRVDELMKVAFAAWHEDPTGDMPSATDIREDLIVVDGDEAFYLSGHPITALLSEQETGRPAAARAMTAIYKAAF